jgi:hypothetical protein
MRPAAIWVVTLSLLLLFGLLRLPVERSLENTRRDANLHTVTLDISLRERIGQLSYAAALSGFRSVVAAFLWIEAHTAWEQTAWGRMAGLFESVTSLQPRSLIYWDLASWHMAWNASIAARENPDWLPEDYLPQMALQSACLGGCPVYFCAYDPRLPDKQKLLIRKYVPDPVYISEVEATAIGFLNEIETMFDLLTQGE